MKLNIGRNAALLIAVSLVGGFGSTVMMAASGIWVMSLTGSESLAALVGMCIFVPTLAGPLLGAVADRLPSRPLLIWTNILRAIILMLLFIVQTAAQTWLIFAVMLCYGISFVLADAAESALLPQVLAAEALGQINGTRMSAHEGVKLVAPLLGAGMFAWKGGQPVVLVSVFALVVASLLYSRLPRVRVPGLPQGKGFARQGIRYLWQHPVLRPVVLAAGICVALSGFNGGAVFALVARGLSKPPEFMGVLGSAQGAGSIVGGLAAGWALQRFGAVRLSGLGALVYAAGIAVRCFSSVPAAIVGTLLIGIGLPLTVVAAFTAVQQLTPADLLGRVAGTATTLVFAPVAGAIPLGSALILGVSYQGIFVIALLCGFAVAAYMFLVSNRVIMTG
jgi:MFS family permease